MKYVVALLACAGVIIFWSVIGATVFNWRHGGGFLWQIFIWGTVVAVWVAVTSRWRASRTDSQSSSGAPDRSFFVKALDVFDSIKEHDRPPASQRVPEERLVDESRHYAQAMAECTENQSGRDAGVWAKAFALCEGDPLRTQAKYIEMRARQLMLEVATAESPSSREPTQERLAEIRRRAMADADEAIRLKRMGVSRQVGLRTSTRTGPHILMACIALALLVLLIRFVF